MYARVIFSGTYDFLLVVACCAQGRGEGLVDKTLGKGLRSGNNSSDIGIFPDITLGPQGALLLAMRPAVLFLFALLFSTLFLLPFAHCGTTAKHEYLPCDGPLCRVMTGLSVSTARHSSAIICQGSPGC